MKLKRYLINPILTPNPMNLWESKYVFNPGVIYDEGLFHMLYRAQGADMVSRFGYAVSKDGVHFNRMNQPVLEPENICELYGIEDARITKIDHLYYVCYTAYSLENISVALATTKNFFAWQKKGVVLGEGIEKHAAILPEKIGGEYIVFHSMEPDIYLSKTTDFVTWSEPVKIVSPRIDKWDKHMVGVGAVPIKTEEGWLVLYHGVEEAAKYIYRLGFMLLDLNDPARVLKRSEETILEAEKSWEIAGGIPMVVFSNAMVDYNEDYYVYYGGADSCIGLATISKKQVRDWMRDR